MKIIFLDIDGVLNSDEFFASNHEEVKKFKYDLNDTDALLKRQMMDIDYNKLMILKGVIQATDAKVVIISSTDSKSLISLTNNSVLPVWDDLK